MKKRYALVVLICIVSLIFPQLAFAHGVVYDMKSVGANKVRITLKWSNPKETKGLSLAGFSLSNGKTLTIAYEVKGKGPVTTYLDYDLKSAIPPIRVLLSKVGDIKWLPFKDIKGIEAVENIRHLHDAGIIDAGKDEKFRPNDNITRAEFADMLCKALKLSGKADNTYGFTDIAKVPESSSILLVVKKGVLPGYSDKTFRPKNPMTVAEVCTSLSKAFTFKTVANRIYTKLNANKPYSAAVKRIFDVGILSATDSIYAKFNEESKISRANAAMMISRALSTY